MTEQPERPVMIYHVPYPLERNSKSGSGIRPVRMREAFEAIGYDVQEVSGTSAERARQIRELKRRIRGGLRPEFVYSESSTMPTPMTDSHHLPLHPRLDLAFLAFCRRQGIRTGLFYRDIYWQFPEYLNSVSRIVALGTRFLYRRDLRMYRTSVDRLFLPSMRMAEYLPAANRPQAAALPPGSPIVDVERADDGGEPTMLFVGGLGDYYRLHECVVGVESVAGARLIVCTRPDQWAAVEHEYTALMGGHTEVVHASGAELEPLFAASDMGVLFLEPIEYREFAAPLKLYEYIGHGLPIVATEGTLAGDFVAEQGIGWALPYAAASLSDLLTRLRSDPAEYARKREAVRALRGEHTWEARARQAAETITQSER